MSADNAKNRLRIHGIPVHSWNHEQVLEHIAAHLENGGDARHICITNTESMYHARRLSQHRAYIEAADLSLCDGMGVVLAGRVAGKDVLRYNGPVLVEEAIREGVSRGWRHFFCGGKEGVADLMSRKLAEKYPGMINAGTYCPPFRDLGPEDEQEMLRVINEARPDFLWVGLGLLKQEEFIDRYKTRLNVPWLVGVGAAFDYHAGTARWAPRWIRRIGFEWLYRLCFEPRMFKRNVYSFIFMFQAMGAGLIERVRGSGSQASESGELESTDTIDHLGLPNAGAPGKE